MTRLPPHDTYVDFALYDADTGEIHRWGRCPASMVEAQIGDSGLAVRTHAKGDAIADYRIGAAGRLVRRGAAHIDIEAERAKALLAVDRHFARLMDSLLGPFAAIHRMKREQADAGGGPLVADEAERRAVLACAARQDAALVEIERRRLALKKRVRAAASAAAIADILGELT